MRNGVPLATLLASLLSWAIPCGHADGLPSAALQVVLKLLPAAGGEIEAVEVAIRWDRSAGAAEGRDGAEPPLELRMPHVQSNVDTVAREIEVQASDARGTLPLAVRDDGEGAAAIRVWRATRAVEGALRLRYRAGIHNRLGTRGAAPPFELRSEAGAFSGAGLAFLLLPETEAPHRLSLHWDLSALPAGGRGVSSLGVGDVELETPAAPARLARAFYMAGRVGLQPENATDRGFFGAWMGEPPFDARELLAWTERLYAHYGSFFGDATTVPRYGVFLRRNLVNPGGGVGLQDSFVGTFDTGLDVEDFRLTLAHEMFHTRSPYIVNPPGLASQWFAEGLA
ncbi:MAG: peptidase M61, partial [Gammaproteobacteria bacterium]|nr:peptidase M61 [Gammaproteobacteria bacterium]